MRMDPSTTFMSGLRPARAARLRCFAVPAGAPCRSRTNAPLSLDEVPCFIASRWARNSCKRALASLTWACAACAQARPTSATSAAVHKRLMMYPLLLVVAGAPGISLPVRRTLRIGCYCSKRRGTNRPLSYMVRSRAGTNCRCHAHTLYSSHVCAIRLTRHGRARARSAGALARSIRADL